MQIGSSLKIILLLKQNNQHLQLLINYRQSLLHCSELTIVSGLLLVSNHLFTGAKGTNTYNL